MNTSNFNCLELNINSFSLVESELEVLLQAVHV
jgi:hypothetical protein